MASRKAKSNRSTVEQAANKWRASTEQTRTVISTNDDDDFATKPLSWWRARWGDRGIRRLFIENFITVRDAFDDNKLTRLQFNDLQADLHNKVIGRDAILKFRRGGSSTYWKAAYLADAVVLSGQNVRVVPQDPDTEAEFRADFKVMFENLPEHLRPATRYYSLDLIHIDDKVRGTTDSKLTASTVQPGHEGKGRGQTITRLHLTEVPHWRGDPKKAATALTEAAAGGQIAAESTAFGIDWFYGRYQDGKTGRGGWKSHFYEWWWKRDYRIAGAQIKDGRGKEQLLLLPGQKVSDIWRVRPAGTSDAVLRADRDRLAAAKINGDEMKVAVKILRHLQRMGYASKRARWYCDEVAEYLAWRRAKIEELVGGERQFLVEYPENDQDCFENTGRSVISAAHLKVSCDPSGPIEGHEYLVAADTSLGTSSSDPAAIEVIDLVTGAQVHSETLLISPDQLAYKLVEISDRYNWAMIAVERNNTGVATIKKLLELVEPERVYKALTETAKRAVDQGKITHDEAMEAAEFGIATTTANKGLYGVFLERAIRTGEIGLSSQEWCEQARTVIWISSDKWEAMPGFHDDKFMALAIANFVRVEAASQSVGFVGVLPETGHARTG